MTVCYWRNWDRRDIESPAQCAARRKAWGVRGRPLDRGVSEMRCTQPNKAWGPRCALGRACACVWLIATPLQLVTPWRNSTQDTDSESVKRQNKYFDHRILLLLSLVQKIFPELPVVKLINKPRVEKNMYKWTHFISSKMLHTLKSTGILHTVEPTLMGLTGLQSPVNIYKYLGDNRFFPPTISFSNDTAPGSVRSRHPCLPSISRHHDCCGRTWRYVYEGRGDTGGSCRALKSLQVSSKPAEVSLQRRQFPSWSFFFVCGVWWPHIILTSLLSPNVTLRWSLIWLSENNTYKVWKTVSLWPGHVQNAAW